MAKITIFLRRSSLLLAFYFYNHGLVGGKLAEEKEELRVGQVRTRLGEG